VVAELSGQPPAGAVSMRRQLQRGGRHRQLLTPPRPPEIGRGPTTLAGPLGG
jgi:hypothetical protein